MGKKIFKHTQCTQKGRYTQSVHVRTRGRGDQKVALKLRTYFIDDPHGITVVCLFFYRISNRTFIDPDAPEEPDELEFVLCFINRIRNICCRLSRNKRLVESLSANASY